MRSAEDRIMLEECLARLEGLVNGEWATHEALNRYFAIYGAEHSQEDCPEDDTCECPEHVQMTLATARMSREVELARRRIDKLRAALAGGDNAKR
jgi:hypothetical protein